MERSSLNCKGMILDDPSTNCAECRRNVTVDIRSLVNAWSLLHEAMLVPVLLYGSETMVWREKKRSRMDNLRGLRAIRRRDRVPNARIRELCGVTKGVDERTEESVLQWFSHIEIIGSDRISIRVYESDCVGNLLIGRLRKR